MTRHERLMNSITGKPVDRPPVCFYEITGEQDMSPEDPYNVYSHPSWRPLIELAREKTDRIVMRRPAILRQPEDPVEARSQRETWEENGSRYVRTTIAEAGLSSLTRRDLDVNTTWRVHHLLKDLRDLDAYLALPMPEPGGVPDISEVLETEAYLGDTGIVMLNTADPLCYAADLFDMGTYTVVALTERKRFRALIERFAARLHYETEAIARALPGRIWRIYGPEFASEPYLPPELFEEYAVAYFRPMVESIQRYGGFARIHSHGRLRNILDAIVSSGCVGLDPIEPPPQGDVSLRYVRRHYGRQLTLFGNLEASDIVNATTSEFETKVRTAVEEGTEGEGRGFVLMPSACPYSRVLPPQAMKNYETMVRVIEAM